MKLWIEPNFCILMQDLVGLLVSISDSRLHLQIESRCKLYSAIAHVAPKLCAGEILGVLKAVMAQNLNSNGSQDHDRTCNSCLLPSLALRLMDLMKQKQVDVVQLHEAALAFIELRCTSKALARSFEAAALEAAPNLSVRECMDLYEDIIGLKPPMTRFVKTLLHKAWQDLLSMRLEELCRIMRLCWDAQYPLGSSFRGRFIDIIQMGRQQLTADEMVLAVSP